MQTSIAVLPLHQTQPQRSSQAVQVRAEKQARGCFCQTLGCTLTTIAFMATGAKRLPTSKSSKNTNFGMQNSTKSQPASKLAFLWISNWATSYIPATASKFDHAIVGAIERPSFKSVRSCSCGFEVRARGATFAGYTEHCGFPSLLTKLRGLAWNFVIGGTSMEWSPSLSCTDCFTCQVFSTTGFTPVVLIQPHPTSFRFP